MSQMYFVLCAVMFISGTTATDLKPTIGVQATTTGDIVNMITLPQLPGFVDDRMSVGISILHCK